MIIQNQNYNDTIILMRSQNENMKILMRQKNIMSENCT